jgi:hypothetical protein
MGRFIYQLESDELDSQHTTITNNLQYDISADPNAQSFPPDDLVYSPPTTITVNPVQPLERPSRQCGGTP